MVIAAYLTTAFVVGGAVGAYHLLRRNSPARAGTMFSMAMWMAAIVAPIQIVVGDAHGLNTLEHQPAKVMAMEGHFDSHPEGAPLILFGLPNQEEKRVDYAIQIPKLSSLILKHDLNAISLAGLDTIDDDKEPPVAVVFCPSGSWWRSVPPCSASVSSACSGAAGVTLFENRLLHRIAAAMAPAEPVAVPQPVGSPRRSGGNPTRSTGIC